MKSFNCVAALAVVLAISGSAMADITIYSNGFNGVDSDWLSYNSAISVVNNGGNNVLSVSSTNYSDYAGAFTRFDGYRNTWPGSWSASADFFINPAAWSDGQGFDYSVAINGTDGNHNQDMIFHAGMDNGQFKVNASNNTDFQFNALKLNNENDGDFSTITTAGWYTFEQQFLENGDDVDSVFNVYDENGILKFTATRETTEDLLLDPVALAGNRYGWITYLDNDLLVDNVELKLLGVDNTPVPEPATMAIWGAIGGLGLIASRRRRNRKA